MKMILFIFTLLLSGQLVQAQINMATCQKPSADKSSCEECKPHYHQFEGNCFVDITGC